jgi:hypothetical protein
MVVAHGFVAARIIMNLQQFRVLSAMLRMPEFTTAELIRESGASPDVVRKTFQRFRSEFLVVRLEESELSGRKQKVRTLTSAARERLTVELARDRSLIPPPDPARTKTGDLVYLLMAERAFYEDLPGMEPAEHVSIIGQTKSYLRIATQQARLLKNPDLSETVERRRQALEKILHSVEALHDAYGIVNQNLPSHAGQLLALLSMALNTSAAQEKLRNVESGISILGCLQAIGSRAPKEAKEMAAALVHLGQDPTWQKSLHISRPLWTSAERDLLEQISYKIWSIDQPPSNPIRRTTNKVKIIDEGKFRAPVAAVRAKNPLAELLEAAQRTSKVLYPRLVSPAQNLILRDSVFA